MQQERLQELYDELSASLVLYARGWCNSPDDAVQEAFIDLTNCSIEPISPAAWLYQTTRRKAQNIARADGRRRLHYRQASEDTLSWFVESRFANEPAAADVVLALKRLTVEQRELVVARIWGGLGFEQLAELQDCSVSSAHRRYTAALSQLKSLLEEPGDAQKPTQNSSSNRSRTQTGPTPNYPASCADGDIP